MTHRVYVGRLPQMVRERDIEKFFKGYGKIQDIILKNGYGFLEFDDARDAEDAVYDLNGRTLLGERIIVEHARSTYSRDSRDGGGYSRYGSESEFNCGSLSLLRSGPPVRTEFRVRIENISSRVSWQDLKDFLNKTGEVCFCDCNTDRKNEGVAEFATLGDMKNVITKLNGKEFKGRNIRIIQDKRDSSSRRRSDRDRSRSRSGSRHRSYTPSRSRSRSPRSRRNRRSGSDED